VLLLRANDFAAFSRQCRHGVKMHHFSCKRKTFALQACKA
jgi:hypothetical protein